MPDLGGSEEELNEGIKKGSEPVVEFSYDNTLEEIDGAMKSFQQKYKSRRGMLSVAAYGILTVAVIVAIHTENKVIIIFYYFWHIYGNIFVSKFCYTYQF